MSKEFKTFLNETKQYLSEASTADATYTEMAICVAYNKKLNHKDPIKAAGISPSNWKKVSKSLQNTGTAVVNDSKLSNVGGVMIHSGAGYLWWCYAESRKHGRSMKSLIAVVMERTSRV